MDDEDGGILNIEISDDEVDVTKKKADRTGQTEDEFQVVKQNYQARVENGEIHKHVQLPLQPGINKMRTQEVIHAVEELYFHRRYQDGVDLVNRAFGNCGAEAIDNDSRQLLETYREKCQQKVAFSMQS
ncbi:hypothetical protein QQS21_008401 [Conoideocrella luteorostrata]|uniref:Uncharacterized protein n=1 Tax=Conoideocrella luteorostrata TaxID=1105319 RepID=A0AAJ0CIY1_9HYPO|nr:hypothetical protein QQS21_008401 [Conoideocrella luteorostrata]